MFDHVIKCEEIGARMERILNVTNPREMRRRRLEDHKDFIWHLFSLNYKNLIETIVNLHPTTMARTTKESNII